MNLLPDNFDPLAALGIPRRDWTKPLPVGQ